ncbi:hypothetical protein CALCODRAFT_516053 [Calocera cornea HHB12733]|uniref:Tyrosine-protein kinase ephrin type A/B receptor-like domain-containing protein n=1 Tax=Calocera cornea HHB12733 TaxID=1353952 RepID=A0A165HKT9_9BASI|nr:hypothetical protein CALCODRAFT_516053 [Calocera cornea HHB12733]
MFLLTLLLLSLAFIGVLGESCTSNADCTRGDGDCVGYGAGDEGACIYLDCYAGYFEAGAYSCGVCPAGTTSDPNGGDPSYPSDARCYQPCADGTKCYTPQSGTASCSGTPSTCVQKCATSGYVVYEGDGPFAYCGAPPVSPSKRAIARKRLADKWHGGRPW